MHRTHKVISMRKLNPIKPLLMCKRCGHQWQPKKNYISKVCPKCQSPDWNRPKLKNNTETKTTVGGTLKVGIPGILEGTYEKKVETFIKPNSTER